MVRFSEIKKILKSHGLRITDGRVDVLEVFMRNKGAMSVKGLHEHLKDSDRVTLYRILSAFLDHGILHKIPVDNGSVTYGLCYETCDSDHHYHDHMHFECSTCGTIECLNENIPFIKLPGYDVQEAQLLLKGVCKTCVA